MKKIFYFIIVILFCLPSAAFSQITILSGDMPAVGDTLVTATDTLTTGMTTGSAGVNQVWDFSNATPDRLNTNYIVNPTSTPYSTNFPTANRAGTQNFIDYIFTRVSGQKYELVGATVSVFGTATPVPYSPTDELYRFPTQYNNKFSGSWGYQILTPFSSLPANIQQQIQAGLPAGVTVTEFRTTNTATFTDTIDGWGTTITPVCSYHSLRQKRVETTHFKIEAHAYFFGIPTWQSVVDTITTTPSYNWLAKETKLPLVTAGRLNGTNIGTITYSLLPPALIADLSATTTTSICPGGTVSYSDISEGCPDSVLWSFPGGTPSTSTDPNPTGIVYSSPGTYSVSLQITRNGATTSKSVPAFVTVNSIPVANAGADAEICSGNNASLSASGGTSYSWSSGAPTANTSVSPLVNTTYTVTVTNSFSCTASDDVQIIVNPLPTADAGINDTICQGNNGSLIASGGDSYSWSNGDSAPTLTASPAVSTVYTVTVTDVKGCSATDNALIEVLSLPAADAGINDTICRNDMATLTASGGVNYLWSSGETTAQINVSPAITAIYTVTVSDINGCESQDVAAVIVHQLPVINLTDVSICFGSATILDAGNPGASYTWSDNSITRTLTVSTGGTYGVSVTDINGCVNTGFSQVTVGANLTVNLGNHTFCNGDSVILDAGNPGTHHVWSTGDTMQFVTVFSSGSYDVTVTDNAGCVGQSSGVVTVNPNPAVDAGANDTICFGATAQLTGTSTAAFLWSTGESSTSISVNPSQTQTYSLIVTDANNCTSEDSVSVIVNLLPVVDAGANDTVCSGAQGTLTATGSGTFSWSSGETTATIAHVLTTTTPYSVQLTDVNGCTTTDNATIVVRQLPVADAGQDVAVCAGEEVVMFASGGIQYAWSNGETNASFNFIPDSTSVFDVTVSDVYGCQDFDTVEVTVFPLPQVSITGLNNTYCPNSQTIPLNGIPLGGSFSGTGVSGNIFSPAAVPAGFFDITYTFIDVNSCTSTDTQQVEVFAESLVNFADLSPSYCANAPKDTLEIIPAGGILSGAGISGNIFDAAVAGAGGPYAISYARTDSFGCFYSDTAYVLVKPLPVLNITGLDTFYCVDASPVTIAGNPAGGVLSGTGVTNSVFNPAQAGLGTHTVSYTYTGGGCTNTETVTVRVQICSGITEQTELLDIKVYPNPAADEFFVDCNTSKTDDLEITLTDVSGKVVYASCCQSRFRINLQSFSAGLYFARIQSGQNALTKKVIVSKN